MHIAKVLSIPLIEIEKIVFGGVLVVLGFPFEKGEVGAVYGLRLRSGVTARALLSLPIGIYCIQKVERRTRLFRQEPWECLCHHLLQEASEKI